MIRVLIVDDERMVCTQLRTILSAADDLMIVGEAYDGAEAVECVIRHRPHVVLMDLHMPGVDGLAAIEHIARFPAPPKVVVLTTFDRDGYVLRAMTLGAAGFLLKDTPPEDLIGLVRVAADGHTVLSPAATRRLLSASAGRDAAREEALARIGELTDREMEVLACLGKGLSNAQIARRLFLSEATVKSYVSRMLVKLGLSNRTQAGLLASDAGITATAEAN
ncbi:DNA-binding NarL/FixJ family response regulator [Streptosporangium becharense]|uniref:DNA-binding NarL/FixJ family response regulator n=1 Tax=Streptosporangium becharense TaxID=1816182 RepID=A0A7W9MJS1_9ACTN|nr:response regulator transcription factor [Streptosporangium becharense]MBB2915149.1 DNA-binding NarL/FixJ family response regulator [Streptosporangium becharense]MBB5822779.1 DNA-binding NarL/FixJ family response regulator [Streptosporangium becharense]